MPSRSFPFLGVIDLSDEITSAASILCRMRYSDGGKDHGDDGDDPDGYAGDKEDNGEQDDRRIETPTRNQGEAD